MIRRLMDRLLDGFNMALLATLVVVTSVQVLNRYLIKYPLPWTEEIARFLLIWSTLFGAVLCVRDDSHIEMDYFYRKMGLNTQRFLSIVGILIFLAFNIFVVWQGTEILRAIRVQHAAASSLSMAWVYIAGPLSALLMIVYLGGSLVALVKGSPPLSPTKAGVEKGEDI